MKIKKIMKTLVYSFLGIMLMTLCCGLLTIKTEAATIEEGGVKYQVDTSDHTAKVSWENRNCTVEDIVIKNKITYNGEDYTVTEVSSTAFDSNTKIKSLKVEEGILVCNYAFWGCVNLKSIEMSENVTIRNYSFSGCSGLTSISINNVTGIGIGAFEGCSSLTSVTIPNSVTSIGISVFEGCSSLTSVTIPNSVTSIEQSAFQGCSSITSVTIPNSVTSIGQSAFEGCSSITSVTIPNSVTSIGIGAFQGCSSITSVTIPNSVTSIGQSAFQGCSSITSVTIPNSVTSIEQSAFKGCSSITSVTIPSSVTSIEQSAFEGCSKLVISVPNTVEQLGEYVFYDCKEIIIECKSSVINKLENQGSAKLTVIHSYTSEVVSDKYIKSKATCTSPAVYYKSCTCGKKGTDTFISGNCKEHSWDKGTVTKEPTVSETGVKTYKCTASGCTASKTETIKKLEVTDKVEQFVRRIYSDCLNRTPEEDGVNYWTNELKTGSRDGASVGAGFVFSEEYWSKGVTKKEYLQMLYKVFMGREADEGGMNYWLENMKNGMSREEVFKGFVDSKEYTQICADYGIIRGEYEIQGIADPVVKNGVITPEITSFVERIYEKALNRASDPSGIAYWSQEIANETKDPVSVAELFIFSEEFESKNLNNTEYIKVLYRTFMGREFDNDGLNYWLGQLDSGKTRKDVLEAFAGCPEFQDIIKSFGL